MIDTNYLSLPPQLAVLVARNEDLRLPGAIAKSPQAGQLRQQGLISLQF